MSGYSFESIIFPGSLLLNLMHVLYREGYLLISETVCFLSNIYEIIGNTPTGLSF